jgi:hypothetical protein
MPRLAVVRSFLGAMFLLRLRKRDGYCRRASFGGPIFLGFPLLLAALRAGFDAVL